MAVKQINDQDLSKSIAQNGKVIVDCYANWCGPCRMLSPIIDEIADELTDINFYKLDVDESEEIAKQYGIMSIPTLLFFNHGELKEKSVGFIPKDEIVEIIKKI